MAFTLWWGVFAFTLLFIWLLGQRYRLEALEETREDRELEQAIAERVRGRAAPLPEAPGADEREPAPSGAGAPR